MAQNIILKRSGLAGKVPDTGSLNLGEVAINTYDGRVFFKKSGSVEVIEHIITTNSTSTGSITLTKTGSFGELVVTQDGNIQRDLYVTRDVVANGDLDVSGSISGSSARIEGTGSFQSLQVNDTLTVNHGSTIISGSQLITDELTVLGAINARQFNISVISSSVLFQSGSTKFGDTQDDTHQFTGSINVTGSISASTFVGVGNLTEFSSSLSDRIVSASAGGNSTFDLDTPFPIKPVDGNTLVDESLRDIFVQIAVNGGFDVDFNT